MHAALTGPKARQREDLDEAKLEEAWKTLERCWTDLDGLRHLGTCGIIQPEDIERFIDGWQVRQNHRRQTLAPLTRSIMDYA